RRQPPFLQLLNAKSDAPSKIILVSSPCWHFKHLAILLRELAYRHGVERRELASGVRERCQIGARSKGISIPHVAVSLGRHDFAAGCGHGCVVWQARQVNSAAV